LRSRRSAKMNLMSFSRCAFHSNNGGASPWQHLPASKRFG
jgi:hypothetical protein